MDPTTTASLWLAVIGMGVYHGVNPGMGWPLAVSAALMARDARALPKAVAALALGHLAAMSAVLAPLGAVTALAQYERELRLGAGALVLGFGIFLLINPKHPRFLARVPPHRLALWSFLAALAHGAALMLAPLYLGICAANAAAGEQAGFALLQSSTGAAIAVAIAHTLAMMLAGGAMAWGVYRWLGLRFLTRSWFNLDAVWALSLVVVGAVSLWTAL